SIVTSVAPAFFAAAFFMVLVAERLVLVLVAVLATVRSPEGSAASARRVFDLTVSARLNLALGTQFAVWKDDIRRRKTASESRLRRVKRSGKMGEWHKDIGWDGFNGW